MFDIGKHLAIAKMCEKKKQAAPEIFAFLPSNFVTLNTYCILFFLYVDLHQTAKKVVDYELGPIDRCFMELLSRQSRPIFAFSMKIVCVEGSEISRL